MKTVLKQIFSLALVFCLMAALGVTAHADKSTTVNATVGKEFEYSETLVDELKSMEIRGECPGLVFGTVAQGFKIFGTPTTEGTYTLQTIAEKTDGTTDTYTVTINVNVEGGTTEQAATVVTADTGSNPVTAVVVNNGEVTITKHPTGETVEEGGRALFVARAENADSFNWGLYNPSTDDYYTASQALGHFAGLNVEVEGDASDTTLILSNIPYSLNGWFAEARFFGTDKTNRAFSNGARITVTSETMHTPSITTQPVGASLERGKTTTLSVTASAPDGANTLRYQWYKNDTNKNSGGTAISGATSSSYTPPETTGTTYYYVNVWSADATRESTHVNSVTAAVEYPAPPAATPAPASSGAESGQIIQGSSQSEPGTQPAGNAQPASTEQSGGNTASQNSGSANNGSAAAVVNTSAPESSSVPSRSHTGIIVLILVLAAILLAACIALFLLKRSGRYDDE